MTVDFRNAIERKLKELPEAHRERVAAYLDERAANGIRESTLLLDLQNIAQWSSTLGQRPFEEATRADATRYVNARGLRGERASASRTNLRKITVRSFQRWVRGGSKRDPYPPEVAHLEVRKAPDADRVLEEVLTRDELRAIIEAQMHPMDRAALAVLYDSGMRASEFCALRVRDVLLDEYGAVLRVPKGARGLKTGARHVRIIHAVPYLRVWLNAHPKKGDADAALWLGRSPRRYLAPLTPSGLHKKVMAAGEAGGLTRPIWPHLFRHSRATEAAKEGMSESEMRIFFGWTKNSDMPSHYIHLAGKDVDEGILRRAGKLAGGFMVESAIKLRTCVCGHENPTTSDFCESPGCGKPLTVKAAEKQQANTVQAVLEALKSNPALYAGLGNDLLRQGVGRAGGGD